MGKELLDTIERDTLEDCLRRGTKWIISSFYHGENKIVFLGCRQFVAFPQKEWDAIDTPQTIDRKSYTHSLRQVTDTGFRDVGDKGWGKSELKRIIKAKGGQPCVNNSETM